MANVTCPNCRRVFDSEKTRAMPFCSERCRTLDLGRWLSEEQGMPLEPEDHPEPPAGGYRAHRDQPPTRN